MTLSKTAVDKEFTKPQLVDEYIKVAEEQEKLLGELAQVNQEKDNLKANLDQLETQITSLQTQLQEASQTANVPVQETTAKLDTVVIPYRATPAAGDEIVYALRSWQRNYPDLEKVVIIGDLPTGLTESDRLVFIPHTPSSDNPQIDVAHKMMAAIASEQVPDEFIWSNDDIYLTNTVAKRDLTLLTANGKLKPANSGRLYDKNRIRTIKALKNAQLDTFDYATHTPKVFDKEGLAAVIEHFKCDSEGHLISSIYFNAKYKGFHPFIVDNEKTGQGAFVASVWNKGVPLKRLKAIATKRLFLNNNDAGWPVTKKFLEDIFQTPSIFE